MLLYNHDWNVEFSSVFDEPTVLCVLPPHLRNQAYIFAHRQTLATCPLLCSQERAFAGSLSVIVPRLRTAAFVPGQIVNHPRYNCREFHMIVEGSVSITDRFVTEVNGTTKAKLDAECTVEVVGKRSHFGFSTVFVERSVEFVLNVDVRAVELARTLFLNRDAWDSLEGCYRAVTHHFESLVSDEAEMLRWLYLPPVHRDSIRNRLTLSSSYRDETNAKHEAEAAEADRAKGAALLAAAESKVEDASDAPPGGPRASSRPRADTVDDEATSAAAVAPAPLDDVVARTPTADDASLSDAVTAVTSCASPSDVAADHKGDDASPDKAHPESRRRDSDDSLHPVTLDAAPEAHRDSDDATVATLEA